MTDLVPVLIGEVLFVVEDIPLSVDAAAPAHNACADIRKRYMRDVGESQCLSLRATKYLPNS